MSYSDLDHVYTGKGGRVVPSVTSVVVDECAFWTAEGRARGRAIHQYALRLDMGEAVSVDDLPEAWRGYARALDRAYADLRPTWTEVEVARINEALGYGGKRDRVGVLFATVAIVDFKTSVVPESWMGYQLAGYDLLDGSLVRRRRFTLHLLSDGWYKLREHDDPHDYTVFLQRLADRHKASQW